MDHGRSFEYRNLRSANEFSMRSLKIPWWVITLTSSSRKCVDAPIFLSSNKSRWVILENASLEKKYSKTLREKMKIKVLRFIAENFRSKIHAKILPSFCWFFHRDYVRKKSVKIFWTWKVFRWVISLRAWWHFWLWFPKFKELIRQHIAFDKTCPLKKVTF